jgi:hypothetical protein
VKRRLEENPFYVLGVAPGAGRAEIEQAGQRLLGMVELGLDGSARYATPFGDATRTADGIRRALAELRDPARRLVHEMWARLDPGTVPDAELPIRWPEAFVALGWRR